MTMPQSPPVQGPIPGQGGVIQPAVNSALQTYDDAYDQARQGLALAQNNLAAAIQSYNTLGPPPEANPDGTANAQAATYDAQARALEGRIQNAQTAINSALADTGRTADARAQAYAAAAQKADPANQATLQAGADKAKTDAARAASEYTEYQNTAPDRKAQVALDQRAKGLANDKQSLDNAFQAETDPTRKALLGQQLGKATSDAQTAAADAGVAGQLATARVQQAGANVAGTQASTGLTGATTAETTAKTARDTALLPGDIAQQAGQLNLTNSQTANNAANTQKTLQDLSPLKAKIDEITQAFKDGKLDALPNPQQMVQDYITSVTGGTTPFDVFKQQQSEDTARLGQQVTQRDVESRLLGLKAGAFGSAFGSGLSSLVEAAKSTPAGTQGQGVQGLVGTLLGALGGQNAFQLPPPINIPNAPSYLSQYKPPPAAAPPPSPAPTPPAASPAAAAQPATTGGHVITINIGGSGDAQGSHPGGGDVPGGGGAGPAPDQTPAYLDSQRMFGVADHQAMFGQGQDQAA